jgi:hypothetical protein
MNALLNAMVVLLSGLAAQDFQVELKGPAKISVGTPVQIAIPAGINVKSKTCLLSGAGTTNLLGQVVEKFSADLSDITNKLSEKPDPLGSLLLRTLDQGIALIKLQVAEIS